MFADPPVIKDDEGYSPIAHFIAVGITAALVVFVVMSVAYVLG